MGATWCLEVPRGMVLRSRFQRGALGGTSAQEVGRPERPRWAPGTRGWECPGAPREGAGMEGSAPLRAPGQRSHKQQHSEPALTVTG